MVSRTISVSKIKFDLKIIVLYAVLVVILFHEFIFSNGMLFGTDSIYSGIFFRGIYRDFVHQYHALPQWNPYILGGLPFIDAMHGDTFYPTSILKFFMPLHRAMGWKLILHIFLAGMFMYMFLKSLKLNKYGVALGGLFYMFTPVLVSLVYAGHDAKIFVIALLPLCFYLLERGLMSCRLAPFLFLGGVVGLLILSSHIQMAYFALWGIGTYFLYRIWKARKKIRCSGLFVVALIVGLGVGTVQLLPSYIYVNDCSVRGEKTSYEHATSWSLHAEEVVSLVVPGFCGDNIDGNTYRGRNLFKLNSEYIGLLPLILAVLALCIVPFKRVWYWAALALLALVYALGANTPFFQLFYYLVPGVKLFRGPSMIMFLFSFSVCTLAAIGFHHWVSRKKRLSLVWVFVVIAFISLCDVWRVDSRFIKVVDLWKYTSGDRVVEFLHKQQATEAPFRVFPVGRVYAQNELGVYRIETVTGFHDNESKLYQSFTGRGRQHLFEPRNLDLLNVRYIIWNTGDAKFASYFEHMVQSKRFSLAFDAGPVKVFENNSVLPRAWIAASCDSVIAFSSGYINYLVYDGNEVDVQVVMNEAGFLVLSDNYTPYWKAYVDGSEKKIHQAFGTLRAVELSAGTHEVKFVYRSWPFAVGWRVSVVVACLLCAMGVLTVCRKRFA